MSYIENSFDPTLRFGDIIRGFQYFTPNFKNLIEYIDDKITIEINKAGFFVVLTPCCSIKDSSILLAPLKEIQYGFFDNPYFEKDLTNINRLVPPDKTVPAGVWNEKFDDKERLERIEIGPVYVFKEFFIYDSNPLLPEYDLKYKSAPTIRTGFYMIDFKEVFIIKSAQIQKNFNYPKILQLTVKSREELRLKISDFYYRTPEEDKIMLLDAL